MVQTTVRTQAILVVAARPMWRCNHLHTHTELEENPSKLLLDLHPTNTEHDDMAVA